MLYAVLAASSLGELSQVWGEIQLAAGAAERIAELLDEKPAIAAPAVARRAARRPPEARSPSSSVSFHYPTRPDGPALEDVSFTVAPGETVALVGPSGAGKTTIFALLQRFYDPQAGRILHRRRRYQRRPIRARCAARIAVVPQETVIFSGSVLDNIRFGRPEASRAEMHGGGARRACR